MTINILHFCKYPVYLHQVHKHITKKPLWQCYRFQQENLGTSRLLYLIYPSKEET